MMTPGLVEKIWQRAADARGLTLEQFHQYRQDKLRSLNKRLAEQLDSQRMTPEILNKRCTL